jgi:hypothetical protein
MNKLKILPMHLCEGTEDYHENTLLPPVRIIYFPTEI